MKTCPFLNAECIKGQCMAWLKIEDRAEDGTPLGTFTRSYCRMFNLQ